MKKYLFLVSIFATTRLSAQYGIDGLVVAINMQVTSDLEVRHLQDIEENQGKIMKSNAAIAVETTAMWVVEEELMKAMEKVSDVLDNAEYLMRIYRVGDAITAYQNDMANIVKERPELSGIYTAHNIRTIKETAFLMKDLLIATKEDKTNLMYNSDRLKIMEAILGELEKLAIGSASFRDYLKGLSTTMMLEDAISGNTGLDVDYRGALDRATNDYQRIFKD